MKRLLIVAAALLVAISASAQKFGVVAGFNSTELKIKDSIHSLESNSISEFNIGLAYNYSLGLGFAIQPAFIYNMKGTSVDALKTFNLKSEISYLEVPVQIQYGLNLLVARPFVFVEPFAGLAVGAKVKGNGSAQSVINDLDSKLEYGLGLGFGTDIVKHLQFSFKYFWNFEDCGFNNFSNEVKEAVTERDSFSGLTVSLGFFF